MISNVHAAEKPQELQYVPCKDNLADVWIRRNILQTPLHFDGGEEGKEGEELEYVYDEVFFRTADSLETIESDLDTYWISGQEWEPDIPLTPEERRAKKIVELEKSLSDTRGDLEKARMDSDMAIAELTIVLAAMMTPTVTTVEEGVEEHV